MHMNHPSISALGYIECGGSVLTTGMGLMLAHRNPYSVLVIMAVSLINKVFPMGKYVMFGYALYDVLESAFSDEGVTAKKLLTGSVVTGTMTSVATLNLNQDFSLNINYKKAFLVGVSLSGAKNLLSYNSEREIGVCGKEEPFWDFFNLPVMFVMVMSAIPDKQLAYNTILKLSYGVLLGLSLNLVNLVVGQINEGIELVGNMTWGKCYEEDSLD